MDRLIKVENIKDILPIYKTQLLKTFKYHNLGYKLENMIMQNC